MVRLDAQSRFPKDGKCSPAGVRDDPARLVSDTSEYGLIWIKRLFFRSRDLMMKPPWATLMALESNDNILRRNTQSQDTETAQDGGRDYSDAVIPRGCLGPPEVGRGEEGSSLGAVNAIRPLVDTLAPDFWPREQ